MDVSYFITEKYIKQQTELQDDVDITKVKRSVRIVQQTFCQEILGTDLYLDLEASMKTGVTNQDYRTLMDNYIMPYTLEMSMYKALPFLNYSFTNKSIVKKDADNTTPTELPELKYLQQQYRDSADFLGQRTVKYLIQSYNNGKFPLYGTNVDSSDIQPNKEPPYLYGGIYLADADDDCDYGIYPGRWKQVNP